MEPNEAERRRMAASGGGEFPATLVPGIYADYLPDKLKGRDRDFFGYRVESLPLAAAGVATPTMTIEGDSEFLAVSIVGVARDPAAVTTVFAFPAITLNIYESGTGRNFFSGPVDWGCRVGTALQPAFLPYPKLLKRTAILTWTFTNLDAAQAYDIRLILEGFKIFDMARG